jgi:hypothetical protein
MLPMKMNHQLRADTVAAYLRGAATQEEFCASFAANTGHPLSPRTLRSWIARLAPTGGADVGARALLADALDQVRTLEARLQAALDQLNGAAAAPVPDRHVDANGEDLPPAASAVRSVGTAAVAAAMPAAADQPLGIAEGSSTDEPELLRFSWD